MGSPAADMPNAAHLTVVQADTQATTMDEAQEDEMFAKQHTLRDYNHAASDGKRRSLKYVVQIFDEALCIGCGSV
jgi:hypothetical protein